MKVRENNVFEDASLVICDIDVKNRDHQLRWYWLWIELCEPKNRNKDEH
jgi:hypothetical protein